MTLDPHTLLFSLIVANALMVLSLFLAVSREGNRRDGMGLWAAAMTLQTLMSTLIATRGTIPDAISLVVANGLSAGAYALMLAALCEFQHRSVPRWQYFVPIALAVLMAAALADDVRSRFAWGGLIYGFQMVLILRILLTGEKTGAGSGWRLLFAGVAAILVVQVLRMVVALFGWGEFTQPQNLIAPHSVQIISYLAAMATTLLGSIGFVLMIKERTDREVRQLAMTDSLTRIPNRRALLEQAEHMLARRDGLPLALLMIDVDDFKRINSAHGHLAGESVLRYVTRLLVGRLRGSDMLGRYGADEFCVIAPDTDADGAMTLAESLREIIAYRPVAIERGELPVTVSVGVAHCPAGEVRELKKLITEADAALYAAKENGRNRVVCFKS